MNTCCCPRIPRSFQLVASGHLEHVGLVYASGHVLSGDADGDFHHLNFKGMNAVRLVFGQTRSFYCRQVEQCRAEVSEPALTSTSYLLHYPRLVLSRLGILSTFQQHWGVHCIT
jgi:hypothetical protein